MTRLLDERLDSRRSMNDTILTAHRDGAQMSPFLAMALDEYTARHEEFLQSTSEDHRVIIYVAGPDDGYGNRLPGLIWTFVWALLDGRIFLVSS